MSLQRYRVLQRLDSGGMAEVFKGVATSLRGFDKVVAIKRVLPNLTRDQKFVRMFLDEARLSLYLNHANIVQVFDLGHADDTYFIVMEFVDGVNLKHVIEEFELAQATVPLEQACFIAAEVCKGLDYAHNMSDPSGQALGIVHRDISPPNILLSIQGEVKIADFGLAKARSQVEHTDPGFVKGKFGYLSPEAAYGEAIDSRTDIFAVGIVLWEMLAGRRLFQGRTDMQTLDMVRKARIPALSQINARIPKELEAIVNKALARDKNTRFQRSDELGEALAQFLFDHSLKVTSFDVANLVKKIRAGQPEAVQPDRAPSDDVDSALNRMIQSEISHFISDRTIQEGLHNAFAKTMGDQPSATASPVAPDGGFENPASWFEADANALANPLQFNMQTVGPAAAPARSDEPNAPLDIQRTVEKMGPTTDSVLIEIPISLDDVDESMVDTAFDSDPKTTPPLTEEAEADGIEDVSIDVVASTDSDLAPQPSSDPDAPIEVDVSADIPTISEAAETSARADQTADGVEVSSDAVVDDTLSRSSDEVAPVGQVQTSMVDIEASAKGEPRKRAPTHIVVLTLALVVVVIVLVVLMGG